MTVKHAIEIMIWRQKQIGRVIPCLVAGKPGRIGVAVGTDDWQAPDLRIKALRD